MNENKINKLEQELKKYEIKEHTIKQELSKIRHNIKKVWDSTSLNIGDQTFGVKMTWTWKYEITYPNGRTQPVDAKWKWLKPVELSIKKEIRKLQMEKLTPIKEEISKLQTENEEINQKLESFKKSKQQKTEKITKKEKEIQNTEKELEQKLAEVEDQFDKEMKIKEKLNWEIWKFKLSDKRFNRTDKETKVENVKKQNDVMAIGDTHWNYEAFITDLRAAKIIDGDGNWIGWNKDVVLLGDILWDRNTGWLKTLLKIRELSIQAKKEGGSITLLAWNHDDFALSFLTWITLADGGHPVWTSMKNNQGLWVLEFVHFLGKKKLSSDLWKDIDENFIPRSKQILKNMKESEVGRKLLDVISNYKVIEQIDDTLYVHTDFTSAMGKALLKYKSVDKINQIYQDGLKALLEGKKPSKEFNEIRKIFLHTGNRNYLTGTEAKELKKMWINRIIHWHTDHGGSVVNK